MSKKKQTKLQGLPGSYETSLVNPLLSKWLKKQGASEDTVYSFVLEKGSGERVDLIFSEALVTLHFYRRPQ